jgi:hypothetical protein
MCDHKKHYIGIAILSCILAVLVSFLTTLAFTKVSNDINKPISELDMRKIRTEITNELETMRANMANDIRSVQTNIGNDIRKIQTEINVDLIRTVQEIKHEI